MNRVPPSSFQFMKDATEGDKGTYYENLLEVNIDDKSLIYDLDQLEPAEINFVEKTSQLAHEDTFVNSGTTLSFSDKAYSKLHANE